MSARVVDINGWFEVADNPISKEGVFPYSGGQIGAPDAGRIYNVYRPADELSDPDAIASFRLMPIIDEHTMLGEGHTAAEEKGVAGVIGENVRFAAGKMLANIKVFSDALAKKIKSGKTQLSLGYRCIYDFTPGVWNGQPYDAVQRQIRGNHLALVDEGRMGPEVAILDHMVFTVDAKEIAVDEELKKMFAEMQAAIGALSDRVAAMEKPADDMADPAKANVADEEPKEPVADKEAKPVVDGEAEAADEEAKPDEAMDALTKEVKALADRPVMDEAAVVRMLAEKNTLADKLAAHVGTFDHRLMTLGDVVKYGVDKLNVKVAVAGQEAVALDAYLQAKPVRAAATYAADAAQNSTLAKAIGDYATGA